MVYLNQRNDWPRAERPGFDSLYYEYSYWRYFPQRINSATHLCLEYLPVCLYGMMLIHTLNTLRFEAFAVMKILPVDGSSKVLRNVGILPQSYTASQPKRHRLGL